MADFTIYLGNKNYSSWSLRPWLVLKHLGVAFDEVVIPIYEAASHSTILRYSPSGKVPVLHHGAVVIWDSLAICEYLAELMPDKGLWPEAIEARATARAVSAEMHSGFLPLRRELPMNIRATYPNGTPSPEARADIARITAIWRDLRRRFGEPSGAGPFLFGGFTIADAMFAPVVARFHTFAVDLDEPCQAYADALWDLPAYQEWRAAAGNEPMVLEQFER